MKTEAQQPKHAQVEWKVEHFEEGRCWITENGEPLLKVVPTENEGRISQRVVRAVNMHDELVHTSKLLADFATKVLTYPKGEKGYDPADKINLNNQIEKIDKLLKQAEQK